jgi:hypothetical protein
MIAACQGVRSFLINKFLTCSCRIVYGEAHKKRGCIPERKFCRRSIWDAFTVRCDYTGDVAQLGERGVRNAEARGSIPLISTKT